MSTLGRTRRKGERRAQAQVGEGARARGWARMGTQGQGDTGACGSPGARAHIQQQDVGLLEQHAAQRHAPPLAARQAVHRRIACAPAA